MDYCLQYKKSSYNELQEPEQVFLTSLVTVILAKSKWDDESEPDELEDEDKGHFEQLRKVVLHTQSVVEPLLIRASRRICGRSWTPFSRSTPVWSQTP